MNSLLVKKVHKKEVKKVTLEHVLVTFKNRFSVKEAACQKIHTEFFIFCTLMNMHENDNISLIVHKQSCGGFCAAAAAVLASLC